MVDKESTRPVTTAPAATSSPLTPNPKRARMSPPNRAAPQGTKAGSDVPKQQSTESTSAEQSNTDNAAVETTSDESEAEEETLEAVTRLVSLP